MSKQIGELFKDGRRDEAETLKAESKALGDQEKELAAEADEAGREILRACCCASPTCPATTPPTARPRPTTSCSAPTAPAPTRSPTTSGCRTGTSATELGIIDGERAVKISGSMFTMYRGWGARLLRAMIGHSLDSNGYPRRRPRRGRRSARRRW